jgi:hypothetical protein
MAPKLLLQRLGGFSNVSTIDSVGASHFAAAIPSLAAGSLCDAITGNLVLNCGFETGDFTDWIHSGNLGASTVAGGGYSHSGNYGAQLGPVGSNGTLTQVIADAPGTVTFDFWLANFGNPFNDFSVEWDGVVLNTANTPVTNASPFNYIEQGPLTLTSTGSDTLEFIFRQDPSYWGLDDISVVQATTATTPEPGSILLLASVLGLCGMALRKRAARNLA